MTAIKSFHEIKAWQKSRLLVSKIYSLCREEPLRQDWGFRNQICRAAISVMSNIAEGFGRGSRKEFMRYLDIARGSAAEVESLIFAGMDINYFNQGQAEELFSLAKSTIALIAGFKRHLAGQDS